MSEKRAPVDVAAGVLIRADGRFLLASRPEGKPYASYWEFPGGKVEAGESVAGALARELNEELAIDIGTPYPWVVRLFDYPHARVRLHFCRVFRWSGHPQAREHQQFGFFSPHALPGGPLLPATIPVLRWLQLPALYAISAATPLGSHLFLQRLESALESGLRLLQFREPSLHIDEARPLLQQVLDRARAAGASVLVSSRHDSALWRLADGVHLTADDLAKAEKRPDFEWVGASAHSSAEIERAAALGVDFVVAGPVLPTSTHLQRRPLGWIGFADMVADTAVPAYALGGMQASDLQSAMRHGAHGIAALSAAWKADQWVRPDGFGSVSAMLSGPAIE